MKWANSLDLAKRLNVAPCPAQGGCGLTCDSYETFLSQETSSDLPSKVTPKKAQSTAATLIDDDQVEEDDDTQCTAEKIDGSRCPRSFDDGGDSSLKLCRRCNEKRKEIKARASRIKEEPTKEKATKSSAEDEALKKKQKAKEKKAKLGLHEIMKRLFATPIFMQ